MQIITGDFETTTVETDCRVWAWATASIQENPEYEFGNCIESFFEYCKKGDYTVYFHNLKFDGQFILSALFRNRFTHVTDKKYATDKTFTTLISDKGQWYSITIYWEKKGHHTVKTVIYDSLKIIPLSVEQIAKSFGLPISKLEIDYKETREKGHILTDIEKAYIQNDVGIMAMALHQTFKQGLTKMTAGSNALQNYKNTITEKKFNKYFPKLDFDVDKDIRESYRGGFTYLPKYRKNQTYGKGIVLDVNSLYPSVMHDRPLPFGEPVSFEGKYKQDDLYDLYVQTFTCQFELKAKHIPTIQVKSKRYGFMPTEYLENSNGEDITLCMTSVDLQLFFEHYNVYNPVYHSGWKFKSTIGLFSDYIDYWTAEKIKAKAENNLGMYQISKLMLNSLYGKFALNPVVCSKIPWFDYETDLVRFRDDSPEIRNPIYLPVGTFVTAWARFKTISSAQSVFDRFIYADTDSLHLIGKDLPIGLDIDDYKLGAWKHESTFIKGKFLRQKGYMERQIIGKTEYEKLISINSKSKYGIHNGIYYEDKITCAGMQKGCKDYVNFDNFEFGASFPGKLSPHKVPGGVILKDVSFTLKE